MKISATVLSILLRGSTTTYSSAFTLTKAPVSSYTSAVPFSSSLITNLRGGSSSLNMSERPFNTWTFDKHCETMDWSPTPEASLTAVAASDSSIVVDDADLIIVGVFAPPKNDDEDAEDEDEEKDVDPIVLTGMAKEIDDNLAGALTDLAAENSKAWQNGGTAGSTTPVMRIVTDGKAKRYMLLALGAEDKEKDIESTTIMKLGDAVASACHDQKKVSSCNVVLPSKIDGVSSLKDLSTAFYSSLYADNRYRTGKKVEMKAEDVKTVQLIMEGGVSSEEGAALAITTGLNLAKGCSLTKDIVNAPHNVLNSESLADTAKRIAKESGGSISCEILGKKECEKRGMGAYLGVARGSETEPQFIHLTYKPSGDVK